ncbi:MAG: VUT family protein [Spirochaetes bacterium]|nr:MAG: VUT family protein [Spirochaetota bacterium]
MNELLWFLMLLANFGAILLLYRMLGKTGLYLWVPIAIVVANIQVLKTISLFGVTTTLGNIVYATTFLVTDILSENYGKRHARYAVFIGFFSLIVVTILMNLALLFKPAPSDFAQEALNTIFGFMPRIVVASLSAYWLSQLHDVWAYHLWKRWFPETRFIWLRNNASTMVSQLIDTAVFTFMAYLGVFEFDVVIQILWTTYLMKWLVAAADTPLVYIAKRWQVESRAGKIEI